MADHLSAERRSWNMSRIPSKDTSIEIKVRKELFRLGFRYRKNDKRYPGKPDIVLPMYNTVIFIHGCFWHRHPGCKDATFPKSRQDFWRDKFNKNVANDEAHYEALRNIGWQVIILWECEINKSFDSTIKKLVESIRANRNQVYMNEKSHVTPTSSE